MEAWPNWDNERPHLEDIVEEAQSEKDKLANIIAKDLFECGLMPPRMSEEHRRLFWLKIRLPLDNFIPDTEEKEESWMKMKLRNLSEKLHLLFTRIPFKT